MARIIVTTSAGETTPGEAQTVELVPGQVLTIGRDSANRLPLPEATGLSRRHCRVGPREGGEPGWEVADLGSTNKTRVNGNVVQQKVLAHGDEIEVGSARLRFEDPEEAARFASLEKEGVCFLEYVTGGHKGERIPLAEKRTRIGRRETNTLTLDDRMVSGHHAEIDRDLNGYTIRDLGSTNGTLVNGEPVSEALLTHGSRLRIGNCRFAFKDPSMQDVEVELAHFEEDEGWGMMGELDLSRGRGSKAGLVAVLVLFLAAAAGGYWIATQDTEGTGGAGGRRVGIVANGSFDSVDVPWSASREEGVDLVLRPTGGKPGSYLWASNSGEDAGPLLVTYDESIETAGTQPLRFRAKALARGDQATRFVVIWESDPTPDELKAGVLDLERTDVLGQPQGGWATVDETRVPPVWAKAARLGLHLESGATGGVDSVEVERVNQAGERPSIPVRSFKTASLDPLGSLDLMANRTVLLGGVHPAVRLQEDEVLTRFQASGPIQADATSLVVEGVFPRDDGDVAATLTWAATEEGLRYTLSCPDATAVGLVAAAPAQQVGGSVNVLGSFHPQSLPVQVGQRLERVSRTLLGEPAEKAGAFSSLVAIVQDQDQRVATLEFLPSLDPGLVVFRHWIPGSEASIDVVTDFSRQKDRARDDLMAAENLARTSPGVAIVKLREVAQANPFDPAIRDRASQLASELETKARNEIGMLELALQEFGVYRSADALEKMMTLAAKLTHLYPAGEGPAGSLETDVKELAARVDAARHEYAISTAAPGVDRLERLATLLEDAAGYRPMAALYARAMIERYASLEAKAEDIARRLQSARERLEKLGANEDVQAALPPLPKRP